MAPRRDYVPLILHAMADRKISMRKLAVQTGISRNRLTALLRATGCPRVRESMTLTEFETILDVLDMGFIQTILGAETLHDIALLKDGRFSSMMQMLSEVATSLPIALAYALNDVEGMDGTEIRREWAGPLRDAVVDRVVREVLAIIERRARLSQAFHLG